jgi:hypothetical protein
VSRICSDSRLDQIIDMKHALVKLARDEALCDRWVENPCFQYFCGEEFFQHALVFDRSSLTRWRQRMGQEKLKALLQESLAVATRADAPQGLFPARARGRVYWQGRKVYSAGQSVPSHVGK